MSINKATILGNVCADPKVTNFQDGGKVAQFTIATNKPAYKTRDGRDIPEQTEFHLIVINRASLAEVAEKYLKKGNKVYVEGELRTRKYTGADNIEHFVTEIYADTLELLTPKPQGAPAPAPEEFGNY